MGEVTPLADDAQNAPQLAGNGPETREEAPKHQLDLSPKNSKIVVVWRDGAILATPDGESPLPKTDPANKLPVGAQIWKKGESEYESKQLGAVVSLPDRVYPSAFEAIACFVDDFHPSGLHS